MDKYDFQILIRHYGFNHRLGGGIYAKDDFNAGNYSTNTKRQVTSVKSSNTKLRTICLVHGIKLD